MIRLIKPEKKYLKSYYEACIETWGKVHDDYIIHNPQDYESWKNTIFKDYEKQEKGIDLPHGFVPSVTFWAVEGDEYIGTINIRPVLNDMLKEYGGHIGIFVRLNKRKKGFGETIVRMSIDKAFFMGINEILLTCEETNIPSWKILDKYYTNKVEKDTVILNGKNTQIRRYYYVKK